MRYVRTLEEARRLAKEKNGNLYKVSDSYKKQKHMKNRYQVLWGRKK